MNANDSVKVAYGSGPKEMSLKKGMPSGDKQFGKDKMPQDETIDMPEQPANPNMETNKRQLKSYSRHKEHR